MKWINRVSKLFQPTIAVPKSRLPKSDASLKSYQLMINAGIISNLGTGMYAFLPLGLRVIQKLIHIISEEMRMIGGQQIILPVLTSTNLWQKTSRFEEARPELFLLNDRHGKEYLLSPTFEETATNLISQLGPLKRNQLPLRLYQISSKWRDEMKPRLGLIRSREFIMKDMYTFDTDAESAEETYNCVNKAYENIFTHIGIPYKKVAADSGIVGGSVSHEYHYESDIGEDTVLLCENCKYYENILLKTESFCPRCNESLHHRNSIEVGHTFLLGTKYSEPLKAKYIDYQNKCQFLEMGCFGLGLSRIISSAIEILSTYEEIRWPLKLAPYSVCIIPPKAGSKEEFISGLTYDIYFKLIDSNIDVIVDDRVQMTIGRRFIEARKCGYPFVIIIGKNCLNSLPLIEVHNIYKSSHVNLPQEESINYLKCMFHN